MLFNVKLVLLPPLALYFLICAVLVGFSLTLLFLARWSIHSRIRQGHNELAGYLFTAVGVIYGVLLAFVAIIVWEQCNDATGNVVREASRALALYRDLDLYPDQTQADPARQALKAFMRSVVKDEYPALARGEESPATQQAMEHLWKSAKNLRPRDPYEQSIFGEILKDINALGELRTGRLAAAQTNLPDIVWVALIIGAGITLVFSMLFGAEKLWVHVLMICLLAALMATTLFLILEMDNPFMGALAPQPTVYMEVLERMGGK
jgi:lipid-A-disaccharide synthase-like uncharacterized protein